MTAETEVKSVTSSNGHVDSLPQIKQMSAFQSKYFKRLLANFDKAQAAVMHAQDAANEFIIACAEEQDIQLGKDGWTFDQENLEFIKVPQIEGNSNGNNSRT